jgi:NitT/TauT family transport system ATP-binding protein
MSTTLPAIEIKHLHKSYLDDYTGESVTAIGDMSFDVREGEFVSILGPSGCGKTTVLNIIAGFIKATSGDVLVSGKRVVEPGPDRGVVFQSFALFPWKTALQNVAFGMKVRGVDKTKRENDAREYLKIVGLAGAEDRYPHELSGGMQQRVGVARALANEPKVILMDEPFASVDAQTRVNLQEDLTRIWEQRRPTIFFVTHDVDEAVFLSDRIIVLAAKPGRVREIIDVQIPRPRRWDQLIQSN